MRLYLEELGEMGARFNSKFWQNQNFYEKSIFFVKIEFFVKSRKETNRF